MRVTQGALDSLVVEVRGHESAFRDCTLMHVCRVESFLLGSATPRERGTPSSARQGIFRIRRREGERASRVPHPVVEHPGRTLPPHPDLQPAVG